MPLRSTSPSLFADNPSTSTSGWVTAHCDGGARGNPGPAGYGAVITGSNGELIAELSEFLGLRTNNYAEYSGLLAVLEYALAHNHRRLRVVSDSELMVKQIQGKYRVNSPDLKPLWQEAKNRIARLDAFEISHALRHKNKDADRLANEAMDRGMKRPHTPGQPAPSPLKATPYPTKSSAPPDPDARPKPAAMLRGFTRDGVVHVLGGSTLPDGIFVKIIPE
jgi:ribonuclease HI